MRKKLASLVAIEKQKLDEQERLLSRNQILIMRKREEIDSINAQIAAIPIPTSGSFGLFQMQRAGVQAYLYEIDEIREQIAFLLKEQEIIKQNIRRIHIEHEKMLYVYNQEKDKHDTHMKNIESKEIDENGILLHARK